MIRTRVLLPLLFASAAFVVAGAGLAQPIGKSRPGGGDPKSRIISDHERDAAVAAALVPGKPDPEIPVPASEMVAISPDNLLVVDTNKGRIVAELSPLMAPVHVARIQALARRHFYDGLTFFRVIASFMDQTGDPKNTGEGGSDLPDLKGEFTFRRTASTPWATVATPEGIDLGYVGANPVYSQASGLMAMTKDGGVSAWGAYCPGVLGMARETEPDTANSQFFFMRDSYPTLERKYTAFGRVLIGQDVVKAIKVGEPVADPQDRMTRVRLASDLPAGEKVILRRQDPQGSAFKAQVEHMRDRKGADFSVCDLNPTVRPG
ncbi:peptidylprolyl isomerase [soil metagenome]